MIIALMEPDIRETLHFRLLIKLFQELLFVIIFAQSISSLVNRPVYLNYIIGCMIIASILTETFETLYNLFYDEKSGIMFDYLLSLPLSRKEFLFSKIMGSLVQAFIFFLPLLIFYLYLFKISSLLIILEIIIYFIVISILFLGLLFVLIVIIGDSYLFNLVYINGIQLLRKFSTIFYPISVFPTILIPLVIINPLSVGANEIRVILSGNFNFLDFTAIGIMSLCLLTLGLIIYDKKLERSTIH